MINDEKMYVYVLVANDVNMEMSFQSIKSYYWSPRPLLKLNIDGGKEKGEERRGKREQER